MKYKIIPALIITSLVVTVGVAYWYGHWCGEVTSMKGSYEKSAVILKGQLDASTLSKVFVTQSEGNFETQVVIPNILLPVVSDELSATMESALFIPKQYSPKYVLTLEFSNRLSTQVYANISITNGKFSPSQNGIGWVDSAMPVTEGVVAVLFLLNSYKSAENADEIKGKVQKALAKLRGNKTAVSESNWSAAEQFIDSIDLPK